MAINWADISINAPEIKAKISARRRADTAAGEEALVTTEVLEHSGTAAAAEAQVTAISA